VQDSETQGRAKARPYNRAYNPARLGENAAPKKQKGQNCGLAAVSPENYYSKTKIIRKR